MRYQLSDGTWVEEDASGNVTATSGPDGNPVLVDTSIVNSFLRDAFGSISAAIRRDYALAPATPAATTKAAPVPIQLPGTVFGMQTQAFVGLIIPLAGLWLLYRAFR
jgi:hypothetical protein